MKLNVIFATYKRPDILNKTLESMLSLETSSFDYSIIIVDNAGCADTAQIVGKYFEKLPIVFLKEVKKGKNCALNTAIKHADGDYYVFTDDDVIVDPKWLSEIANGVRRWSSNYVFGGKILPYYPEGSEKLLKKVPLKSNYIKYAYVIADWGEDEKEIHPMSVWGANVVIKSSIFSDRLTFNENVGPQGSNYIMGSETELLLRLHKLGYDPVYLPKAMVRHQIRLEQLSKKWLRGRAFRSGRGGAAAWTAELGLTYWFGIPRFMFRRLFSKLITVLFKKITVNRDIAFDAEVDFIETIGTMYQMRINSKYNDAC